MKKKHVLSALLLATTSACVSYQVIAEGNNSQQSDQKGPPPEAITACENMSSGDTSSFTGRDGNEIEGTCTEGKNGELILRPTNAPEHR